MWYGPHRMTFTVKRPYFFYFGFVRGCHHCFGHFELDLNLKTHNYVQIYVFSRNYDFLRSIITVNVRNFYFKNLTFHDFFFRIWSSKVRQQHQCWQSRMFMSTVIVDEKKLTIVDEKKYRPQNFNFEVKLSMKKNRFHFFSSTKFCRWNTSRPSLY